jgi:hypothetical protein
MGEKVHWAEQLARSDMLPKDFRNKPANVLWAVEYAEALRLPPIAAITGVHVMDGKPTPSAALMSALVRRAGHRCRIGYTPGEDGRAGWRGVGWCEITRGDDPDYTYRVEWEIDRAVTALLCTIRDGRPYSRSQNGKPQSWEKYPQNMLKWRALSECARDACEEALMGMHYLAEELGAEVDADGQPVILDGEVVHRDDVASKLVGDPDEPDWDAQIAQFAAADDADAMLNLWRWARQLRPNDTALHERIAAEGAAARARNRRSGGETGPERPQDGPGDTGTPPDPVAGVDGPSGGPDDAPAEATPGAEYPDGTYAADVIDDGVAGDPGDTGDTGYQLPVPPASARQGNPAQQAHHRSIMTALGKVQGWRDVDDDTRRAFLTRVLRREITSQAKVYAAEAGWLIPQLVAAETRGELGVLVYTALGRALPDPNDRAGLPDPGTDEATWHAKKHPVWRRAQLDTAERAEDCGLCTARRGA